MKIDIRKIESGEDEVILRYKEETDRVRKILDVLRDGGEKIYGKKDSDVVSVFPADILYIESVDERIYAYTPDDVIRLEGTLAGIIQKLNDVRFFRCSKSMIINIDKVNTSIVIEYDKM